MRLFRTGKVEVYCQNCGRDITKEGGYITASERKIYCRKYEAGGGECIRSVLIDGTGENIGNATFYKPREVRKAIKNGRLVHFGPLEKAAQ